MAKRASTDYSFVVAIDKPAGLTSHDVVNRVRRIYGERRVGHTGTLDPAATGVLLVCVGPATRLDNFLVGHSKVYDFSVVFGIQTATDDAEGSLVAREAVPKEVYDPVFAHNLLSAFIGPSQQLPPAYSAIKVAGQKAYDAARAGKPMDLKPRDVEVYSLELQSLDTTCESAPTWQLRAHVSAGTYVRSLSRDIGFAAKTVAHVGCLRRICAGNVTINDCVRLEALEAAPFKYILDPVKLLGVRFAFMETGSSLEQRISHGNSVDASALALYAYDKAAWGPDSFCSCTSGVVESNSALVSGEIVAMIKDNKLAALYEYDEAQGVLKSACGFSIGVKRGADI